MSVNSPLSPRLRRAAVSAYMRPRLKRPAEETDVFRQQILQCPTPPIAHFDTIHAPNASPAMTYEGIIAHAERLLKNASEQLGEAAQLWSLVASAQFSAIDTDPDADTDHNGAVPVAVTGDLARRALLATSPQTGPAQPDLPEPKTGTTQQGDNVPPPPQLVPSTESSSQTPNSRSPAARSARSSPHLHPQSASLPAEETYRKNWFGRPSHSKSRTDPAFRNVRMCPDCGRKGNGSKSQNGMTYFYCRNFKCPGRGSTVDKYIGWTNEL